MANNQAEEGGVRLAGKKNKYKEKSGLETKGTREGRGKNDGDARGMPRNHKPGDIRST